MFVNNSQKFSHDIYLMDEILELTKNNCIQIAQYFNSELIQEICTHLDINNSPKQNNQQQLILVPNYKLQILHEYLDIISIILLRKFTYQPLTAQPNQYTYLRKIWQNNHTCQAANKDKGLCHNLSDKFDNLNQKISMLKFRTRHLIQKQLHESNNYWEKQLKKQRKQNVWEHPIFQKMNKDLSNVCMKNEQLTKKMRQVIHANTILMNKNVEYQNKILHYKEKNKKIEKQMFQMAKKKMEIEKQLIVQKNTKYKYNRKEQQKQRINSTYNNKQNQNKEQIELSKQAQFIMLLQQDEEKYKLTPSKQTMSHYNPLSIKQKFRHAKNIVKRTTAVASPNSSIDSIRNVKFQRTSLKKLLIKGQ